MKSTLAFVQGPFLCIDVINPHTGRSSICGHTLEQVQKRYPGAEIVELGPWVEAKEKALCSAPVEISEDRFVEMLEVLPPQNWQRGKNCESFEICEHTSGRVTTILCRFGSKFYEFQGITGQSLAQIEQTVRAAFP